MPSVSGDTVAVRQYIYRVTLVLKLWMEEAEADAFPGNDGNNLFVLLLLPT